MTEFFNALGNFKPRKRKPDLVTIDGKIMEVSHETMLEIQKSGIEQWMLDSDGKIVKKPIKKTGRIFNELKKSKEGYVFLDRDPYWPVGFKEGGYTWQTPLE